MEASELLDELQRAACTHGLQVRTEPFEKVLNGAVGGLCRIKGKDVALLNAEAPVVERAAALAEALVHLGIDASSLPAEVARVVQDAQSRIAWRKGVQHPQPDSDARVQNLRVLLRPKPGLRRTRR